MDDLFDFLRARYVYARVVLTSALNRRHVGSVALFLARVLFVEWEEGGGGVIRLREITCPSRTGETLESRERGAF